MTDWRASHAHSIRRSTAHRPTWLGEWVIVSTLFLASCSVDDRNLSVASGGAGAGNSSPGNGGASAGAGGASPAGGSRNDGGTSAAGSRDGGEEVGATPREAQVGVGGSANRFDAAMGAPPILSGTTSHSFGQILELGAATVPFDWTITNDGDYATTVPTLSNSNPTELLVVNNGCLAAIGPRSQCTLSVAFQPAAFDARTGSLTLTAAMGGAVTLTATAVATVARVTIQFVGNGQGGARIPLAAVPCNNGCSILFDAHSRVSIAAVASAGSLFAGWSGVPCWGHSACSLVVENPVTLTGTFTAIAPSNNNLIFTTLPTFARVDAGSASTFDAMCNQAATAAGINDVSGTAYVAFVSEATSLARSRLGSARGWVRLDGKPFADTQDSLFNDQVVYNDVLYTDTGGTNPFLYITGTNSDGTLGAATCDNWTTTTGTAVGGSGTGGPFLWAQWTTSDLSGLNCQSNNLLCMGRTKTAPVLPIVTPNARKIWLSNTPFVVGGGQTPDAKCQAERPAGVTTAVAFLDTTTRSASALLDMTMKYARPDGTLVGTGAQIAGSNELESGIWQCGDSVYRRFDSLAWTGAGSAAEPASPSLTCGDWTNPGMTGRLGFFATAGGGWWSWSSSVNCNEVTHPIYCVQIAP